MKISAVMALAIFSLVFIYVHPTHAAEPMLAPARIVAIGDLHGDLDSFLTILKSSKLVDDSGKWTGGKAHLVVVGDYHDRGPDTRYIMDYFFELKDQAEAAGGKFDVVMGNHEMLVVSGDLRYALHEELEAFEGFAVPELTGKNKEIYERIIHTARFTAHQGFAPFKIVNKKKIVQPFPPRSREAVEGFVAAHFGNTKYASWIREGDPMIQIGRNLFVHGGITEWAHQFSYSKVNSMIRSWVEFFQGLMPEPDEEKTGWTIGDDGPLWDRKMATNKLETHEVREILKKLGVQRVIVGHTPKPEVEALYENQVFAIDTGNSTFYGGTLSWVEILNDETPMAFYVSHPKESSKLRNSLICRFRTQQGKSCAPYKKP